MTTLGWPGPGLDQGMYQMLTEAISRQGGIDLTPRASDDSAFDPGEHNRKNSGEYGPESSNDRISRLESAGTGANLSVSANTKNRQAQRRYRERQKGKMEKYKPQVDELNKRLEELMTENESLETRNRLLEKVVQMKDQKPATPVDATPSALVEPPSLWQNMDTYAAVADYINTIRKQRPPLITPTEAAHISPEDLRQARVDYVKELAKLLLEHGDNKDSEGYRQLEDYVLQARLAVINLLNSMSVRSFAQVLALKKRMVLTGHVSKRVMAALSMTSDQKRDYIKARKNLIARNEEIMKKRRRIVSDLELAIPSIAPLMCGQTGAMLKACESSDQFKASLEEEHCSMGQFHIDCAQVLTPLQEARSLLEAHPGNPDPWLISGYLEAEQQGTLDEWMRQHNGGQTLETTPVILAAGLQGGPAELSSTFSQDLNHIASTRCGNPQEMQFQGNGGYGGVFQNVPMGVQLRQSTSQDLLATPTLDMDPGLDAFGSDDMWVDFFPGLLTQ